MGANAKCFSHVRGGLEQIYRMGDRCKKPLRDCQATLDE
jgi:hypothetical protein